LDIKFSEKQIGNKSKIIGVTKGSGMINPQMATTLTFIVTDLKIDSKELQNSLDIANAKSFNQITVDGDTSTNDMILVLANGASGEKVGKEISHEDFHAALTEINVDLAKQVVIDGEGATKIFEIQIKGSSTEEEARIMAKGVANSLLVKTAIFGNDPNWGRFLAAAGQYGQVDMEKARLKIFDTVLLDAGKVCEYDKPALSAQMKESKEIKVELIVGEKIQNLGLAWGCDLSYEYVRINAEYTT
jgi:glutamate N-acetyltransferase/amino-acid N-acetyltransferase